MIPSSGGDHSTFTISSIGIVLFFLPVYWSIMWNWQMFTKLYARRHRLVGGALLLWLSVGGVEIVNGSKAVIPFLLYDIVLGILGTSTAITAAYDFKKAHSHVKNVASGTLEKEATVTFSEMIEHSFYQGLNLIQILHIHVISNFRSLPIAARVTMAVLATAPWLVRNRFPVNRFSDNYNKGQNVISLISLMYRTKKYQYVFYKHFLLHGLNISVTIHNIALAHDSNFRLYWLCLNISYVMEFFLQTFVKKRYMEQSTMIWLQILLMGISTVAAVQVLRSVDLLIATASLLLNFCNRGHELTNCMICIAICTVKFILTINEYN